MTEKTDNSFSLGKNKLTKETETKDAGEQPLLRRDAGEKKTKTIFDFGDATVWATSNLDKAGFSEMVEELNKLKGKNKFYRWGQIAVDVDKLRCVYLHDIDDENR